MLLRKLKLLISLLAILALLLTSFTTVGFADRGEREYRRGYDRSSRYDRSDRHQRYDRSDRDDEGDDRDRDDDDDVTSTPPVVEPPVVTPPALDGSALYDSNCSGCHGQSNKGRNVPSSHLSGRVNLTPAEQAAINAL